MIDEVAPGIFAVEHQVAEGKNAIVLSQRGAWAVDSGTDPAEGQSMYDFICQQGFRPDRLIYTHGHGDHVLGSCAFQGADVIAHVLTPLEIERLLPSFARRSQRTSQEVANRIAWPTITFSAELYLDLGDKHLHLFPTPGHSQDGISVFVEEEKLLIAGDSVVTGIVPAIGDGDSTILERSLGRLAQMDIHVAIPGHGPVVYGADPVRDWLAWVVDYLRRIRARVRQALQDGVPPGEITAQVDYDQFVGERFSPHKHNMPKRHAATVRKIITEEMRREN